MSENREEERISTMTYTLRYGSLKSESKKCSSNFYSGFNSNRIKVGFILETSSETAVYFTFSHISFFKGTVTIFN